ncbi:hypothetical protein DL95DRAFT_446571 [Leptodontidium sp. 2 PMI_412]|nr:hypothetical protein DL95DRAFT_446571 [Leptodontidium sp. 2 PMI_412]
MNRPQAPLQRSRYRRASSRRSHPKLKDIIYLPALCFYGPFLLISALSQKIRNRETAKSKRNRARQGEIDSMPEILCPRLQRFLTIGREDNIPLEENVDPYPDNPILSNQPQEGMVERVQPAQIHDQSKSPLFKLPLEIRQHIYDYVLGGCTFHIHFLQGGNGVPRSRMSHCQLRRDCLQLPLEELHTLRLMELPDIPFLCGMFLRRCRVSSSERKILLPLIMSCRRIYSETINILYKSNSFHFDSLSDVLRLSLTVLPERILLMKDVSISLNLLPDRQVFKWILYTWMMRVPDSEVHSLPRDFLGDRLPRAI